MQYKVLDCSKAHHSNGWLFKHDLLKLSNLRFEAESCTHNLASQMQTQLAPHDGSQREGS
jgi:hypothetical protein